MIRPEGSNLALGGLIATLAGLCGCSGESAAVPVPERASDLGAWETTLLAARCERDQRCEHRYLDEAACRAAEFPSDYDRYFGGVEDVSLLESVYRLADKSTLDACLRALSDGPCDDVRTPFVACAATLVALEPRTEGEPCRFDSSYVDTSSCGPGLACTGFPGQCGGRVCKAISPAAAVGDGCAADTDCDAAFVCLGRVCAPRTALPAEGETCDSGRCQMGLECSGGWCIALAEEGDRCKPDSSDPCPALDLSCAEDASGEHICTRFARLGDPCPRAIDAGSKACESGMWCVFAAPDAEMGTCGAPPRVLPSPCSLFASDHSLFCPFEGYADTRGEVGLAYCMCLPVVADGGECELAEHCASGRCLADDTDARSCVPRLADGESCVTDTDCESIRCDTTSLQCASRCAQ